jgi:hypothetical protein
VSADPAGLTRFGLTQGLEGLTRHGDPYFVDPKLIVVPEVTIGAIRAVVERLAIHGSFKQLKPLP